MMALMEKYGVRLVCAGRWDVSTARPGRRRWGKAQKRGGHFRGRAGAPDFPLGEHRLPAAWDKLYHRSLFASARYPLGVICEDVPTTYRIALDADRRLCCLPRYNYYHRPGASTSSSVSEKTFHFSRHTAEVYPFIRDNYPEIADAARYLREFPRPPSADAGFGGHDTRQKFAEEYRLSRKALCRHISFLLTSPLFGRQERVTDLLLAAGLYRPCGGLYHGAPGKTDTKSAE